MIKAVIIEDDNDTRLGLMDMIEWNKLGIILGGSAENGRLGVDLVRKVRPDIAILDVCMPIMNGIECAQEIRKFLPQCNFIFLSGYSDKEYLKGAIKLQAVEYLEKPVDIDELTELLLRTTENYEIKQLWKGYSVNNDNRWQKIVAKASEYINLWINNQLDEERFVSWSSRFQITMDPNGYFQSFYTRCMGKQTLGAEASVKIYKSCEDAFPEISFVVLPFEEGILTIAESESSIPVKTAYEIAEKMNKTCEEIYFLHFATALSAEAIGYRSVAHQFTALKKRIQLSLKYEKSIVITPEMSKKTKSSLSEIQINHLLHLISTEKSQVALHELKGLAEIALEVGEEDIKRVQTLFIHLYYAIHNILSDKGIIGQRDVFTEMINRLDQLMNLPIPTLVQLCTEKLEAMSDISSNFKINDSRVKKAILYMQNNYSNEISLDTIAKYVCVSSAYLSCIFKRETDKNVMQYLEDIRLTKAFSLLSGTDMNVADIARKVGYNTPHYFAQIFKKATGISPSQYRK